MIIKSRNQLSLGVRLFVVKVGGYPGVRVQAASRSAAKYRAYKLASEADCVRNFRDFLARGISVREKLR